MRFVLRNRIRRLRWFLLAGVLAFVLGYVASQTESVSKCDNHDCQRKAASDAGVPIVF